MVLKEVNPKNKTHIKVLYDMLGNRPIKACISHRKMPTYKDHEGFVKSNNYKAWYLICDDDYVGNVYITHGYQIGLFLYPDYCRQGIGTWILKEITKKHPCYCYYANVSPFNKEAIKFLLKNGFKLHHNIMRYSPICEKDCCYSAGTNNYTWTKSVKKVKKLEKEGYKLFQITFKKDVLR